MAVKILVIDDHPGTMDIISMTLQRNGYDVYSARSGREGLQLAEAELPALILLDVMMPDMDGLEVCRKLRQNDGLSDTPIIMFTALSRAEDKLAGFAAGADDYLSKPTRPNELLRRVQAILARSGSTAPSKSQSDTLQVSAPLPPRPLQGTEENATRGIDEDELPPPIRRGSKQLPALERVIAVLGVVGGAGTTTTAINVAVSLADDGRPTTLVDLDMEQGHVALHLGWKKPGGLNTLAGLTDDAWTSKLDEQLIVYGNQLQLLLSQPNLAQDLPVLTPEEAVRLLRALRARQRCVVVDAGRGLSALSKAVLSQATEAVICVRPDRVSILAAKQLVQYIQDRARLDLPLHLVLLSFHGKSSFPLPVIEDFIGHPIRDEIVLDATMITRAVNKGLPLVRIDENASYARQYKEFARLLLPRTA